MTVADAFWTCMSLAMFWWLNYHAYKARNGRLGYEQARGGFGLGLMSLVIFWPMFLINTPKPIAFPAGFVLLIGTLIHVIYSWIEILPSTSQRRRDAKQELLDHERDHARRQQAEAELARKQALLDALTVDASGVTSIAKQIVADLSRANS
jgi:hypothetical protein